MPLSDNRCMRVIPALLFSIATSAAAQYTYIVPVAGFALGFENISSTFAYVVNPNVTPATLRYQAVYPMRPLIPFSACALRPAIVLAPHAVYDDLPRACHEGLHAVVLTSDQPIEVRAEVFYGVFRNQSVVSKHFEP